VRLFALIAAIGILFAPIASADKPSSQPLFVTYGTSIGQLSYTLELYNAKPLPPGSHIVNPMLGQCSWDINDHWWSGSPGYMPAGTSLSSPATCMVSQPNPLYTMNDGVWAWRSGPRPWFGMQLTAPAVRKTSPSSLSVEVCYQPQAHCFSPQPVFDATAGTYTWNHCSQAVYTPGDPSLAIVPGSTPDPLPDGAYPGYGLPTYITVTVTNPTGSRIANVQAYWGVSSDASFPPGCIRNYPGVASDYPFNWYQS
jgi:hypothetical protein